MTQTSKYPNSAQAWVEYLAKRSLPSPLHLAATCRRQLENDERSYQEIAATLSADPILCMAIMQSANASKSDHDVFSKTLDHAISMVGTDALDKLLEKAPSLERKYEYRDYYQAIDSSLLHAYIAQLLAKSNHYPKHQEIFWAALFTDAPIWYLWCFATPLMKELHKTPKPLRQQKEIELFGCAVLEIQKDMLMHIGAPELALRSLEEQYTLSKREWLKLDHAGKAIDKKNSFQTTKLLEAPQLKVRMQSPELYVGMARIFLHYLSSPIARHRVRATSVISALLKTNLQTVRQILTQGLVAYSNTFAFPFTLPAACRYILLVKPLASEHSSAIKPAKSRRKLAQIALEPKKPGLHTTGFSYVDGFKPGAEYARLIKRMKNDATSFDSAHQLMQEVVTAITAGLSLNRGLIALINKDRSRLKAYYTGGMSAEDPLKTFDAAIIPGTIFKILCERQARLWVKADSKQSVANLIPMNFKQLTQTEEGIFVSIFVKERPVAIFYADQGADQSPILEDQFRYVKLMIKSLESALMQLRIKKQNGS